MMGWRNPLVSEIHLQKLPASPAFSHLYSQSLLYYCIMPPHLTPSLPLSLCLPPSLTPWLPLYVLLCLLLSCIASPALWCGTDNQNSAHTHTHRETHAHHFRQPPSLSHTSPLQTRNILQPLVCQFFIKRHCQHYIRSVFCIHAQWGILFATHRTQ